VLRGIRWLAGAPDRALPCKMDGSAKAFESLDNHRKRRHVYQALAWRRTSKWVCSGSQR
jgi:hypothetical protein